MNQKILVVDDEPDIRDLLMDILEDEGYQVVVAENGTVAREAFTSFEPHLVLLDIWMPDIDGISLLKEWEIAAESEVAVVMMSGHGTVETAMEATKYGAQDFLEKPISMAKLLTTVSTHLKKKDLKDSLEFSRSQFEELVGSSQLMTQLRQQIEGILELKQPIFVLGNRGVEKHILASHVASLMQGILEIKWITPNNFYLPTSYDDNCVYFVSDFAELMAQQISQLADYFIQLEDSKDQKNIKFILATRFNFNEFSSKVKDYPIFRENWKKPLYVPSLNEHKEDIPDLLEYYTNWISEHENLPYRHFNVAIQNRLIHHDWQGNLAELKTLIRKLLANQTELEIETEEIEVLLQLMSSEDNESTHKIPDNAILIDLDLDLKTSREAFEKKYLILQLEQSNGNMAELSRRSGQERTYLYRKIKSLGIQTKK